MTKAVSIQKFFSSFGIPAYEENSVFGMDKPPEFPYLTYQYVNDIFGSDPVSVTSSVWDRSESVAWIEDKTEEISAEIGRGGKIIPCDNGGIWIKRGTPFAQLMGDDTDDRVRRMVINTYFEFLTEF